MDTDPDADPNNPRTFDSNTADFRGEAKTIRIGENLHVCVVLVTPTGGNSFLPGEIYSYNLTFTKSDGKVEDLKSLKLLKDSFQVDSSDPKSRPHLCLGYIPNRLPSFSTCPSDLDKLKIVHGSCHRIHRPVTSAVAWIDDIIKNSITDTSERPHQLFLTGDQIYADDVALNLLPLLNNVGNMLLGHDKSDMMEQLPTKYPNPIESEGATLRPADLYNFPAGLRQKLMGPQGETKFTSGDGHDHLLTFGEFCAMYLFSWCNAVWPARPPTKDKMPVFGGQEKRDNETDDLPGHIEYTQAVFVRPKIIVREDNTTISPPDIWKIYTGLDELTQEKLRAFLEDENPEGLVQKSKKSFEENMKPKEELGGKNMFEEFYDSLPKIRRVLANVPTYMIFDDHEVTDDWYLNRTWIQRVHSAPLGRAVIRNGLTSYAIFQDLGNDPLKYKLENSAYSKLLTQISNLFPKDLKFPPDDDAAKEIERLLGMNDDVNSPPDPSIKWNYTVSGPKHMVVVLDVRTRRDFSSAGRDSPPALLSYGKAHTALEQQIPSGPLPSGMEVLIVVSSLTVIGPPLIETIFQPLALRLQDALFLKEEDFEPGYDPDLEAWPFNPPGLEELLKRLEPYRRVVVLSGDVHYAYSAHMSYWKKDDKDSFPARIIQFTSSGTKNVWPDSVRPYIKSISIAQRLIKAKKSIELLGWHKQPNNLSEILIIPPNSSIAPSLLSRTRSFPVLIPTDGWPHGTSTYDVEDGMHTKPDWSWRYEVISDERPDDKILEVVRPQKLDTDVNLANAFSSYSTIARRHSDMLEKFSYGRTLLFESNIGIIKFENIDGALEVRQELFSLHPKGIPEHLAQPYTIHKAILHTSSGFGSTRPKIGDNT